VIKFESNIKEFTADVESAERAVNRLVFAFSGEGIKQNLWPKIKERLIGRLKQNLDEIDIAKTSSKWIDTKKALHGSDIKQYPNIMKKFGFSYTTIRLKGGDWLPIISDQDWKATGTMDDHLKSELDQRKTKETISNNSFNAEVLVDVSALRDEYPIAVDKDIMDRSGGKEGLVRLFPGQDIELIEMLVKETGNLSAELFRKK